MDLTPIPTGNDVQVNTKTSDEQLHAAVAALAGGGFVVTWTSSGQDGSDRGIYGQRYAANGTRLGSEFQVNTFIASEQKNPAVAALAGGGFVVTWLSYGQEGDGSIYGQRYLADGTALGTEFRVNTHTAYDQIYSSVAGLAGGGFVVTWSSWLQDGDLSGIYGQRYAANGTALGTEFRVNTYTTDDQAYSSVAGLAGGGFVVTWTSRLQDGSRGDMYGQRYAADGTALGTEFRVNTYTTSDQSFSSVAALADGGFVVTWSSYGQDGDRWGIYGQGYLADGTPLGSEFRVNQISAGEQMTHSNYSNFEGSTSGTVATLADGRLVQVWAGNGAEEVFFRLINVPDINVPHIVNDTATTNEDTPGNIQVLANDTFDGTPAIVGTTNGAHGTVAVNNNGTPGSTADDFVVYTPAPDFNGTDAFTYTVTSGGDTETGTVTMAVNPVTDINGDTATTNEDTAVNIPVLANDSFGTPQITAATNGAHGAVTINNNGTPGNSADDFVVFTPAPDFNGTDGFTYTVTSDGLTETASVSVTVTPAADIVNDSLTIAQDSGAHNLDLLANDTFENPGRSITLVGSASHGTVAINNDGTSGNTADDFVVYAPIAGYSGADAFTYTVTSGGVTETGTVSVAVTAAPPPSTTPTSGNDDITGTAGPETIVALAGDDIIDGLGAGDLLFGNQGNDTAFGRTGNDTIWGGQGNDSLDGAEDNDFLWGNEGADTIVDGDAANTIVGGQDSSDAADSITAGSGPDLIWGNGGADTITAEGGGNTVIGGSGSDSIMTGSAADIIFGNQDSDTISGSNGDNLIFGGFGDDSILTGSGNDTIFGNENNDTLAGGTGADRYAFLVGSGNDQINGFVFGEGDRLDLQGQTFTQGTSDDGDVLLTLFGGGTVELNGISPAGFSPTFVL